MNTVIEISPWGGGLWNQTATEPDRAVPWFIWVAESKVPSMNYLRKFYFMQKFDLSSENEPHFGHTPLHFWDAEITKTSENECFTSHGLIGKWTLLWEVVTELSTLRYISSGLLNIFSHLRLRFPLFSAFFYCKSTVNILHQTIEGFDNFTKP